MNLHVTTSIVRVAIVLCLVSATAVSTFAQERTYEGTLTQFKFDSSEHFPGTERDVWVYVPKQYDGEKPACLAAFCDGRSYVNPKKANFAPAIFDKLIASGEMPITIGLFANPGVVPPARADALPRFNRSFEYDGLGDLYARFLDEELIPFVAKKFDLKISDDPNDRLVGGASSGGVCAFNAAWSRPDKFRRVWCTVGTFVGLRGGDELHSLVRKMEAKPIRIFMHDGSNDLNIYAGDWWMANQQMQRALQWRGYEHEFKWDDAKHGRSGEMEFFSDGLTYLWKDWPKPVMTHPEKAGERRGNFLLPNEDWQLVSEGHRFTEGPASNSKGEVFFTDIQSSTIHKIDLDGVVSLFAKKTGAANGLMFGPDGRLFACANGKKEIVAYDESAAATTIATNVTSNDLCVRSDGTIYFTSPRTKQIFRIKPGADDAEAVGEVAGCNGILLSPDQSQLYVTNFQGRMVTAFQVAENGDLSNKQAYYWLHLPYREEKSSLDGMTVDRQGWLYVTSKLGIQVCDQAGRVNFIISMPAGERHPSNICFGGPEMDVIYATCGTKVFKRKLAMKGLHSWQPPIVPAKPRL
jgi:sugar lactone lactonase YvrE/enterochelin esterase-like enzyme